MKKFVIAILVFIILISANLSFAKSTEKMREDGDLLILFVVAVLGGALLLGNVLILAISATEKKTNSRNNHNFSKNRKKSRRKLRPVEVNYKMPKPAPNYALRRRTNQNIAY